MANLPVRRMVLYKHGVGFFERYGLVGETASVELVFKAEEMNDVLKSLAAYPQGAGQVLNIAYANPEDKQAALDKAPLVLDDNAALLDLLRSLRGHTVCLHLVTATTLPSGQGQEQASATEFEIRGTLVGVDADTDFETGHVSVLTAQANGDRPHLRTYRLPQLRGLDLLDPKSGDDLRYVLDLSRASSDKRSLTIWLNQPHQDLLVSYITPTPTWRVSYRLVYTAAPAITPATTPTGSVLLQGWGIIDNQLDEDLDNVELTLIAGQPISFVYDLYTPRFIERPQVQDEDRTVTGPVLFEEALAPASLSAPAPEPESDFEAFFGSSNDHDEADISMGGGFGGQPTVRQPAFKRATRNLATTTQIQAKGIARGELFQYQVSNPVSIKRGQSAMVPILSHTLEGRKEHIYNSEKVPDHPVVTIATTNTTGLTLERGPVTVLEQDSYVGEAVIVFTPAAGELFIPYAVDLGIRITPTKSHRTELAAIRLGQHDYLICDEYGIVTTQYQIENRNAEAIALIIEHRIYTDYELFDTPECESQTAEFYRWRVAVPARAKVDFLVNQRQLRSRQEGFRRLKHKQLSKYFEDKFIDQAAYTRLDRILSLYDQCEQNEAEITRRSKHRNQLSAELRAGAEKLSPLGHNGAEGKLRQRYVAQMQAMEDQNEALAQEIETLQSTNVLLQQEIQRALQGFGQPEDTDNTPR